MAELFKRPNSDKWQAWCWFYAGKRRRRLPKSTGIRDDGTPKSRERAQIIADQIERDLALGGEAAARPTKTLNQAITKLIETKGLALKSDATLEIISDKGANLCDFFGPDKAMHAITADQVTEYAMQARRARTVASVSRELLTLRQAFAAIGLPPPAAPDIGKPEAPPQRILDVTEQRKLLAAVAVKRKVYVLALLQLGLRKSELEKLGEIDWRARYIKVHGTKVKQADREMPIPDDLFAELERYRDGWSGLEPWLMLDRELRIAAERAGLVCCKRDRKGRLEPLKNHDPARHNLSTNDLRGTYAHHMAVAGTSPLLLAKYMGTSVRMLDQVYAQLDKRGCHHHEAVARGVPRLRPLTAAKVREA